MKNRAEKKMTDFPKNFDDFTITDYQKMAFVFGLITKLYYYKHDLFGEQVELFGIGYKGGKITLRLEYSWLAKLGWIKW